MDDFQKRMLDSLTGRHEDKIRQSAEHIREHAGYVLRDLGPVNAGKPRATSHYAAGMLGDALEMVSRFAALDAIVDVIGFMGSEDGDKHRGTIREALQIAVNEAENDRQAERSEAALAAMDHED
jgi:hypothetical protein